MNTVPIPDAFEVPQHAFAALEAVGDGAIVVEVNALGSAVTWVSEAFIERFAQRVALHMRPDFVELTRFGMSLADYLEQTDQQLPVRVAVVIHGIDLRSREAVLVLRELPGGAAPLRVCATFMIAPDVAEIEATLPIGERRFRAVADHLLDVVSIVAPDGTVEFQSSAMSTVSRYAAKERAGRPMWELIHPDDHPSTRKWLAALVASAPHSHADCEYRIRRRDGQWRWLRVRGVNRLDDPRVRGVLLQVTDVTDGRVAQLMLSQVQESLQLAVDGARIGFWEYVPQTSHFIVSGEYHRLRGDDTGVAPFTQTDYWESIHPDDVAGNRAELAKVLDGVSDAWDYEYRLRTAREGWTWVQQRGRVVSHDTDGHPARLAGILFDIDRRKRAEEALRESDDRFRLAVVASRGHIYEFDPRTGHVTRWRGTAELIGLHPADLAPTADAWCERIHPEDRERARNPALWTPNDAGALEAYYRIQHADGRYIDVWERAVRVPSSDPTDERMLGIVMDVSAQRHAERLLANAESVARVGSWEFDLVTRKLSWSAETYILHGVTPDSFDPTEETYAGFLTEQGKTLLWSHNAACITAGGSYELDVQIQPVTGRRIWVRIVAMAEMVDGKASRLFGAVQDIDALKRRGVRLQRQSHWLTLALATNALSTWRWYPDTNDFLLDHRTESYLAHLPARSPLPQWLASFATDDRVRLEECLRRTAVTGEPVQVECQFAVGAQWRILAIRANRVISTDGVALIGTLRDVTASRAAERHLRTQAQVLADMGEGVCVAGEDGTVRLTNPAFDRMLRVTGAELAGRDLVDVLPMPEDAARVSDLEVQRSDGTRFFAAVTVSPLVMLGEALRIYIVRDITDRKELQSELLETANREQRRIGSDLHDGLGQELTGIALMLRGLEIRAARGSLVAADDLGEIVKLVNQAIQSTRSLARGLSPVEIERGGLAYAIRALVARARELYSLDIRFLSRATGPITLDSGAKTHLYRIAQEALTNAARHARCQKVIVRLRVLGERVSLSIEDDGVGMDGSSDSGMGMKILRYRAEIIGAQLRVSAAKPSGTRILCTLQQPRRQLAGTQTDPPNRVAYAAETAGGAAADGAA